MKVAITCDFLLERGHYSQVVEHLCELFPQAVIYCFAYADGKFNGRVEQRIIKSTHLSKKIKLPAGFYTYSYQLPALAKNLYISCDFDLIINVTKGFSQSFNKCVDTKVVTYIYDWNFEPQIKKSFLQKIFFSYVSGWAKNTLNDCDRLIVSRPDLVEKMSRLTDKPVIVQHPPVLISDYALFPKHMFKHDYFLIDSYGLEEAMCEELASWMQAWNLSFKFIGPDDHLIFLKKKIGSKHFLGVRCSREHAPLLAGSQALIGFNEYEFPHYAIACMCTGRPVILINALKKWISGTGTYFASYNQGSLRAIIDQVILNEANLDPQKIRNHALVFDLQTFKKNIENCCKF